MKCSPCIRGCAAGTIANPAPYDRAIILDWYDGIVSGFARCAYCHTSYACALVATDEAVHYRIHLCASLPPETFESVTRRIPAAGPPDWPVWNPTTSALQSDAADELQQIVGDTLGQIVTPAIAILSVDFLHGWLATRPIVQEQLQSFAFRSIAAIVDRPVRHFDYWLEYLQIERAGLEGAE